MRRRWLAEEFEREKEKETIFWLVAKRRDNIRVSGPGAGDKMG